MATLKTRVARKYRHKRVRKRVSGTSERPRLNVYRSLNHIYAQVIDDVNGKTLASASTIDSVVREHANGKTKTEQAKIVGQVVAERALKENISKVVFDRGGFKYQGRVKALAQASRGAGLIF
ncbi:MAG: 50S ribosomal protein L18 [Anaerolineaceae bacterium 4572_78]|nr:MAG: 50S ribosomal protein L18 [Anaerolineaceae bacterium 4572_78]